MPSENSLKSSGHVDLVRGLPRGYSKGTIDGLNFIIIQVLYSRQRAGNLDRPEVKEWKFDKNF